MKSDLYTYRYTIFFIFAPVRSWQQDINQAVDISMNKIDIHLKITIPLVFPNNIKTQTDNMSHFQHPKFPNTVIKIFQSNFKKWHRRDNVVTYIALYLSRSYFINLIRAIAEGTRWNSAISAIIDRYSAIFGKNVESNAIFFLGLKAHREICSTTIWTIIFLPEFRPIEDYDRQAESVFLPLFLSTGDSIIPGY